MQNMLPNRSSFQGVQLYSLSSFFPKVWQKLNSRQVSWLVYCATFPFR